VIAQVWFNKDRTMSVWSRHSSWPSYAGLEPKNKKTQPRLWVFRFYQEEEYEEGIMKDDRERIFW
jgi:hypothetical protein